MASITSDSYLAILFRFAVIPMTLFAGVFFPVESLPADQLEAGLTVVVGAGSVAAAPDFELFLILIHRAHGDGSGKAGPGVKPTPPGDQSLPIAVCGLRGSMRTAVAPLMPGKRGHRPATRARRLAERSALSCS